MSDTDDLIAFLRARLDEDETSARAAIDSRKSSECARWISHPDGSGNVIGDRSGHFAFSLIAVSEGVARFVIDHDPARVLREVEAKRLILSVVSNTLWQYDGMSDRVADGLLRALAAVWSDHPAYRAKWKP